MSKVDQRGCPPIQPARKVKGSDSDHMFLAPILLASGPGLPKLGSRRPRLAPAPSLAPLSWILLRIRARGPSSGGVSIETVSHLSAMIWRGQLDDPGPRPSPPGSRAGSRFAIAEFTLAHHTGNTKFRPHPVGAASSPGRASKRELLVAGCQRMGGAGPSPRIGRRSTRWSNPAGTQDRCVLGDGSQRMLSRRRVKAQRQPSGVESLQSCSTSGHVYPELAPKQLSNWTRIGQHRNSVGPSLRSGRISAQLGANLTRAGLNLSPRLLRHGPSC